MMRILKSFFQGLARALARFGPARDGNIALIFAIALVPLLAFVGAAIDYSRANAMKADMQAALDSTALMVSKSAATVTNAQLQSSAQADFDALFTRPEATNTAITAAYSNSGGSSVVVSGSTDMATDFMGIIGLNKITVTGSSTVKWGTARLRVALVLDTTGSMASDGKINALQTATKNLLTQLQSAASVNGDVYVSIVPLSKNVNLDPSNYNANWIDWTDWEAEPQIIADSKPNGWDQIGPGSPCPFSTYSYGFGCSNGPDNGGSNTSTIPSSGDYAGYICPGVDSGYRTSTKLGIYYNGCYNSVPTTSTVTQQLCSGRNCSCGRTSNCTCASQGNGRGYGNSNNQVCTVQVQTTGAPYTHDWIVNDHNTWNGCVTDRGTTAGPSQDYDRLVTQPMAGNAASQFPAEQNSYCSSVISGLSYNWSAMASQVNNLSPLGATNQPIGLVWGWQTLVGGGPVTAPPQEPGYSYTNVIILLSDGLNTLDRWYGNGSSTNTSVDARMVDSSGNGTCGNIKASGVTIYTIQVNTGGDPTSTLLQSCASSSDKFFLLTSANQIVTTFNAIGTNLTQLRVAK
jgi:Flp pilus assembly protein TadG